MKRLKLLSREGGSRKDRKRLDPSELEALRLERDRYRKDLRISIREQEARDRGLREARKAIEVKDRYIESLKKMLAEKEAYAGSLVETSKAGQEALRYLESLRQALAEKENHLKKQEEGLQRLTEEARSREEVIASQAAQVASLSGQIQKLEGSWSEHLLADQEKDSRWTAICRELEKNRERGETLFRRQTEAMTSLESQVREAEQRRARAVEERQRQEEQRRAFGEELRAALTDLAGGLRSEREENARLRKTLKKLEAQNAALLEKQGRLKDQLRALVAEKQAAKHFLTRARQALEREEAWQGEGAASGARQQIEDALSKLGLAQEPQEKRQLSEEIEIAACTIISKNYVSLARAWNESFLRQHPGARTFVLLVDRIEGAFDPSVEAFEVVEVEKLGIPAFQDFAFKYNILELNTAVKPYFLEYLFREKGLERVVYFDPDIILFRPVVKVQQALAEENIVLIPHVLSPVPHDGKRPNETDFLISGGYNLGFLGLRWCDETRAFLEWWQTRVYDNCFSAPERGLFTDQKWMDLVPSLFPKVAIVKDRGYNAAYWNLHERLDLEEKEGTYTFPETPLSFFHFSGLELDWPERISKYQTRFRLRHLNAAYRRLFSGYLAALRKAGLEESRHWPYAFGQFDDGVRIPDFVRRLYHAQGEARERWADPFQTSGENTFREWLLEPSRFGSRIPRILGEIYRMRVDLQAAFPDGEGTRAKDLLQWALQSAPREYRLDEYFLEDFRRRLSQIEAAEQPPVREPAPPPAPVPIPITPEEQVAADYVGPPKTAWKRALQRMVGPRLYRRARRVAWHLRRPRTAPEAAAPASQPVSLVPVEPQPALLPFGVNLFGYFDTESGVGEIARNMAHMLRETQIPHVLVNIEQQWLRRKERTLKEFSATNPYSVNLLMINADQVPDVVSTIGLAALEGRTNIGYWFWELSRFPEEYHGSFRYFDEIWVASSFCLDSISAASPIPVVRLPPGFDFRVPGKLGRKSFGIANGDFVYLYVFDGASSLYRKNPGAVVTAFRRAFPEPGRERLIMKTTKAGSAKIEALQRLAGSSCVEILTDYMNRDELLDLLAAADCYISLHRSEGFGLTILESMAMGKPVVATDYSGNVDFLHAQNGFPVGYRLVPIRRDIGPYRKGNFWADADVHHASTLVRRVCEKRREASLVGRRAEAEVRDLWGVPAASARLRERLDRIILAGPRPAAS